MAPLWLVTLVRNFCKAEHGRLTTFFCDEVNACLFVSFPTFHLRFGYLSE